ncbi:MULTISPECIES: hypothetical protein [unclassified Rhodococcus (in: high G+C Gram-positive bacteria)]|uniref:hypothetical protein n=1 Tax=unclassified Rhodococcus (in: high G+C Gram-positive bacteria) TaxID=192944 RepID=UPI00096AA209|nr:MULTISPECIES: hypothetical protein [unclassified Rhodococcus (in: high G+C Gram-positive bacteria)]
MTDQTAAASEEAVPVADAYHDAQGQPIMAESIVIYIDALATKTFWKEESDSTKLEFVRDWVRQFNEFRGDLDLYRGLVGGPETPQPPMAVTFTDNVAVAIPLPPKHIETLAALAEHRLPAGAEAAEQAHEALDWLMDMVFSLQIHILRLVWGHSRLFRGAVRVGPVYADDWTIIGDGLIDAVMGEEKGTVVPAIQLPEWMVQAYELDASFYKNHKDSSLYQTLGHTQFTAGYDTYSFVFLNYLTCPDGAEYAMWRDEVIPAHKAMVTKGLETNANSHVRFKFLWTAVYHNWVVADNGLDESLRIDLEDELAARSIIVQSLDKAT